MSDSVKMDIEKKKVKAAECPEFRVSYSNVFVAKAFEDQEAKFGLTALFSKKQDLKPLERAATNAAIEKWGKEKALAMIKLARAGKGKFKWPFRDGTEERPDTEGYKGKIFVGMTGKKKPQVVGPVKDDDGMFPRLENDEEFYSGCYARAVMIASAFEIKGSKGVKFTPLSIQKTRDGEKFGGGLPAEQEFDDIDNGENDEDNYDDGDADNDSGDDGTSDDDDSIF